MKFFIPNNIFERKNNSSKYFEYVNQVKDKLNINSLKKWRINVLKFFDIQTFDFYITYAFSLIREWINQNEVYSEKYLDGLEKNLKKLKIYNRLNALEEEYLNHFRSVLFAKKRNLKNLIVDFPLEKQNKWNSLVDGYVTSDENVYFHFENSDFFVYEENTKKLFAHDIDIFISNSRLIVSQPTKVTAFYLDEIDSYKLGHNNFEFIFKNIKYSIDTEDNYVFYVAFERMINYV